MEPDYALFADVVAAGSLSAAGRRLGISPAMVSKRLARLETRLGARLIHRTTRKLSLTQVGQGFHDDVLAILEASRLAEARVSGERGIASGIVRVSAATSFGRLHVAPHLKGFLDAHPRVELHLDLTDEFVDLIETRTDVAIRIAATTEPHLTRHTLATSPRILCAAPSYLDERGTPGSIAELRGHRLLATRDQLPWRLDAQDGSTIAVDGVSHVRTNSSEVVRELALAGVGVALRSLWDVGPDIAAGRLRRVLTDYRGTAEVGIHAVHPRAPVVPAAVQAFIAYFRDVYAAMDGDQ